MMRFDETLWLFTPEEFEKLPDGIILTSVNNCKMKKGKDTFSMLTVVGHIGYGITNPSKHEQAELFSVFMLSR